MMWGRIRIAVFFIAIMPLTGHAFALEGETAAQQRLVRLLTAKREPARMVAIARLRTQPEYLQSNLNPVMLATQTLLDQYDRDMPVPDSITQLLNLLGSTHDADAHAVVVSALGHADSRITMTAMDTIGQYQLRAAVEELATQIRRPEFDEQYAFRFTLVRAIARLPCARGIELLQQLHTDLRGQLRHEIATRLSQVDLRDFEGDRTQYAEYLQKYPPESFVNRVSFEAENKPDARGDGVAAAASPGLQLQDVASESSSRLRLSDSHYYGIDLHAGRMLFAIDRSGSMRETTHYHSRLQSAKQELIRVIQELSPEADFAIMVFDTTVQSWRSKLLPATQENKLSAIAFVQRIQLGDKTNTHAVLTEALDFDEQLEAVFMLTDGQPTTGTIRRPDAIIEDIAARNRNRHLKFHTIGIGVQGVTSEFLEALAEQTGGEFRVVK